jgi:hypothetical protein
MLNFDFYEKYPPWKCSSLSLLTSHLSRGYNTINAQAKKGFFFGFVEILPKIRASFRPLLLRCRQSRLDLPALPRHRNKLTGS